MSENIMIRQCFSKSDIVDAAFIIFAFLVYPVLGLIFAIVLSSNCRPFAHIVLAFVLASFTFLLIPIGENDLTRWYEVYFEFYGKNLYYLWLYILEKPDYLLYLYVYTLSNLDLPKQLIPFLSIFLTYCFWLTLFRNTIYSQQIFGKKQLLFYLVFLLWIDYRVVFLGVRQGVAIFISVYGAVTFCKGKHIKGLLITIMASMLHLMTSIVPVVLIVSRYLNINISRVFLFCSAPFLILANSPAIEIITGVLPKSLSSFTEGYTVGYWAQEFLEDRSFKGLLQIYIRNVPIYITIVYLMVIRKESELRKFVYLIGGFVCFTAAYADMFSRYGWLLHSFLPILLLMEYEDNPKMNLIIRFIFGVSILVFLCMLFSFRDILGNSIESLFLNLGVSLFFTNS